MAGQPGADGGHAAGPVRRLDFTNLNHGVPVRALPVHAAFVAARPDTGHGGVAGGHGDLVGTQRHDHTRLMPGDRAAVHFAWYGPNTPEKAFGYRVIGDGFVIEMGSVDEAAQHLHTIYHDLGNVLGRAA